MKPYITVLTLGVNDLEKSVAFYRDGLGLRTEGIIGKEFEYGAVAFFELNENLKLGLWPRSSIEHDTGIEKGNGDPTAFTVGHNVSSREEVDELMTLANSAGGKIIKAPIETFYGGYAGYFQDPDGHIWEIAFNPEWEKNRDEKPEFDETRH